MIKLLVISIVANNFLGFSKSETTMFSSFPLLESWFKSVWESEKNATSVPETKAEQISKAISMIPFTVVSKSIEAKNKNKIPGSESKRYVFG